MLSVGVKAVHHQTWLFSLLPSFLLSPLSFSLLMYVSGFFACMNLCTTCILGIHRGQKRVSNSLGARITDGYELACDAGNQTWVLCTSSKHPYPLSHLAGLSFHSFFFFSFVLAFDVPVNEIRNWVLFFYCLQWLSGPIKWILFLLVHFGSGSQDLSSAALEL